MRIILFLSFLSCSAVYAQTQPAFQVYLLGNTSVENYDDSNNSANLLKQIDWQNENSAIIFLGNDISIEHSSGKIPNLIKSYRGKSFYIPGSSNTLDKEEAIIEDLFDDRDVYIPDDGCPGPEVKKLSEKVKLIALNSQWWLNEQNINDSECRNKNKFQVIQELKELLDKNDDKFVILTFYHSIFSDGLHNGYVQSSKYFLPPIIGLMRPFLGKLFSSSQDFAHPDYDFFRNEILESIKGYKNVIVCSANEKSLQYFNVDEQHFVVSGSASKTSPLPNKTNADYAATENGIARLDFNENGSVELNFSLNEDKDGEDHNFHREIIKASIEVPKFESAYDLVDLDKNQMADKQYKKALWHRLIFGDVYRDDWTRSIKFQSLNLSKEPNGLRPIKMGGGNTSTTLHLENSLGKRFVLRSVKKEVSRSVPPAFRNSLVQKIWQDQIAGSQPYAALAVPALAKAAGVYHTNPKIFYVPKQKALGDFNSIFTEDIYLFEERPTGDHKDEETIVESKKIISYSKMIKNIQKSSVHRIRQDQVLRSRLFDIFLGDWDRHDDQWRWASFDETSSEPNKEERLITYYEPVPRDRDQVFYKSQGFGPCLAKLLAPEARKQQNFNSKINKVKYLGFQSRHFDRSFLNGQSEGAWVAMANELKLLITDDSIDEAIGSLPKEIQSLNKEFYKESLIARRNDLPAYASEYYRHLAKYVDIVGTDKKELFEITRLEVEKVVVSQFSNRKSGNNELLYERVFDAEETDEIRIFGSGGNDKIVLTGHQKKGPLIRIIGGEGNDTIIDQANRNGPKKGTWIYDSMEGNTISIGSDTKDSRSDDYQANRYNREEYYFDSPGGLLFFGFNPNDGFNISAKQIISKYGFRKDPFKARHSLNYGYSFGTSKLNLGYELQLTDALGKADFNLEGSLEIPNNVNHFFGLTNEFTFNIDEFDALEELDFFKYSQRRFFIKPALRHTSENQLHDFIIGPYYEYSKLHENENKFIGDPMFSQLDPVNFETKNYIGIDIDYRFTNLDHSIYPTLGMAFRMNTSYNLNASYSEESFVRIRGELTFYNLIWLPKPLVLASKISAGTIYGDFSFFQANFAGFDQGLRAYRQNRFGGKSSFIFSNDLRLKLFNVYGNSLPFSVGIIAAYDSGRVWNPNEDSDAWHNSYGGGFWINFLDIMPLSVYYMSSKDDESSLIIKTGFGF